MHIYLVSEFAVESTTNGTKLLSPIYKYVQSLINQIVHFLADMKIKIIQKTKIPW